MATTKTATPWGRAELVEELTVRQQAGDRRFASVVQLLEAALVADARDVVDRAVAGLVVAQHDLAVRLQLGDEAGRSKPAAVTVLHRDDETLSVRAARRERQIVALDDERHVAADEAQRLVLQQDARQEAGLAQDLEAVADAEHEPAGVGELLHRCLLYTSDAADE